MHLQVRAELISRDYNLEKSLRLRLGEYVTEVELTPQHLLRSMDLSPGHMRLGVCDADLAHIRHAFHSLYDRMAEEQFELYLIYVEQSRTLDNVMGRRGEITPDDLSRVRDRLIEDVSTESTAFFDDAVLNSAMFERYLREAGRLSTQKPKNDVERRAMALLYRRIGLEKRRQLKDKGYFEEKGKQGTYRFYRNDPSGVRLIQKHSLGGKTRTLEWTLCIQSQVADMPAGDVILSRWLELRADEDLFVKTANFRKVDTPDEALV